MAFRRVGVRVAPAVGWLAIAAAVLLLAGSRPVGAEPLSASHLNWVFDGAVQSVARIGSTLYVGGTFQAIAPSSSALPPLYALSETTGAEATPRFPALTGDVRAVIADGAGGFFVGGAFTTTAPPVRTNLLRVLADGSVDPVFAPQDEGAIDGLAVVGTRLFATGPAFTSTPGQPLRRARAVSTVDGSSLAWDAAMSVPFTAAAIVAGDDRIVMIGQDIQPMVRSGVAAAYDSSTGAELWRVLVAPGGVGGANARSAWAGVREGARVIIAHGPTASNAGLSSLSLATGAVDPAWNPGVSPQTMALSGGTLYLGGFFTTIGGQPRHSLAAIDVTTAALLPWNPGSLTPILRMSAASGGGVFVSGLFETFGGQARWRLAHVDAGGAVTPWTAAVRPDSINLLTPGPAGTLLVVSSLTGTGYVTRSRLAAFDVNTGQLLPWAPVADGTVDVVAAAWPRVYVSGRFTTIDGLAAAGGAALDAASGARLAWTPSSGRAVFADDRWLYWSVGPGPSGPFTTERYEMATGDRDPGWRLAFGSAGPIVSAFDVERVYLAGAFGVAALDRRTARVRWADATPTATLALTGDTLYATGVIGNLRTYDTRRGVPILTATMPSTSAAAVSDGRLVTIESAPGLGAGSRLAARRLDGTAGTWDPGFVRTLVGGPREVVAAYPDVVVAGGLLGHTTAPATQGLAAFLLNGPRAPSNLRARPLGPLTEITWRQTQVAPSNGYVLEAGLTPGTTALQVPVGIVGAFSTVVPPGDYYVRIRTSGAAGGVEEVSNEILVRGGCTAPPPPPTHLNADIFQSALNLTWRRPDALVDEFVLTAGTAPGRDDLATLTFTGLTTQLFANVPFGTYYVRIRARNACGTSAPTPDIHFVAGSQGGPPSTPANLRAAVSGSTVSITWDAPAGVVRDYVMELGTDLGLSDLGVVALPPTPSLVVPGVPPGTYVLRLRARNETGLSFPSDDLVVAVP